MSGGLGFEDSSRDELENVLRASSEAPSTLPLQNLMRIHASRTRSLLEHSVFVLASPSYVQREPLALSHTVVWTQNSWAGLKLRHRTL